MDTKLIKNIGEEKLIDRLPELFEVLENGSHKQKVMSVYAIINLVTVSQDKCLTAVPYLVGLLKDENSQVREVSLTAISNIVTSKYYFNQHEKDIIIYTMENDEKISNRNKARQIFLSITQQKENYNSYPKDSNLIFNNLFFNLEYLLNKGKGYSIYNFSEKYKSVFFDSLKEHNIDDYWFIRTSDLKFEDEDAGYEFLIVHQDLNLIDLLSVTDELVNKVIYPAWFKGIPIIFLSKLDKSEYQINEIQSSLIHHKYNEVLNLLSLEQLDNLLNLVNVNITYPEFLVDFNEDVLYTPIEKIFKDKLIEKNISFEPQVKLGRFYVDFLVEINHTKVIVECDGKEFHDPIKDSERDKELQREGYKIFRFSGARIYRDSESCVDEIQFLFRNGSKRLPLEDLNEEQFTAASHIAGPMRVLAPAGSGKTKTLVNRIVKLINYGVQEEEILGLAFNKKARIEMDQRLVEKFGVTNVNVKTFHSLGNEIIKDTLDWKFDGIKQNEMTRKLLGNSVNKYTKITYQRNKDPLDEYLSTLSKVKNELLPLGNTVVENDNGSIIFEPIFNDYLKNASEHNFYNFDDMIYIAVRKLLEDKELRRKIQNQYKYILVDEFQDLNKLQLLLVSIISLPENNLFIVGDDDQMIYSFRGAEIRSILEFNNRFAITSDQVLKINYRSSSNIVNQSRWLIDNNKVRVHKGIQPFSSKDGGIELFIGESPMEQAKKIAQWILEIKDENTMWSDFAVLFRLKQYNDIFSVVFYKYNIPFHGEGIKTLYSGVGKCLFSYLSIILQKDINNPEHYNQILKRPNKYFTNEFIESIKSWEDFTNVQQAEDNLKKMNVTRYKELLNKLVKLGKITQQSSPVNIMTSIVEEFKLKQFYEDKSKLNRDIDSASDYDILIIILNLSENFSTVEEFYQFWLDVINNDSNIEDENNDESKKSDKVNLTTIHKTKGNEYNHVAYFNLSKKDTKKATEMEMEEERRVAYVGVTRPKESLLITTLKDDLSPFIREYFLNPEYNELTVEQLMDTREQLQTKANVLLSKIRSHDLEVDKIKEKYPELNGEVVNHSGLFKIVKDITRSKLLNLVIKKQDKMVLRRQEIFKEYSEYDNQIKSICNELNYRERIIG